MKKYAHIISVLLIFSTLFGQNNDQVVHYEIDLTGPKDDLFHVTVYIDGLSAKNDIYNFVANAPGTYEVLDFGRFVKSFQAYDGNGKELGTTRLSTNRWRIRNSQNVNKIKYTIEDTNDSKVDLDMMYPMEGTGIQKDFIIINTFGVLGFFEGLQSNPIKLNVKYDDSWHIGTSMRKNSEGYYIEDSFDRLADSPILIGELSKSSINVNDIEVNIHTYSTIPGINSDFIMDHAKEILIAAGKYIGYSPVPNYDFLFTLLKYKDFMKISPRGGGGALEHSLSSLYFLTGTENDIAELREIMAHEFLHILTPLNLHSEIIHNYNFITPTPSNHIWLYEGVTEWGSDILQLRGGILDIEDFLENITNKLILSDELDYNYDISLVDMSKGVFNPDTSKYFYNFYQRGAVTACLLDIKLLELTNGNYGLKNLCLDLFYRYGKTKPFPENELFDIIVDMTYPEIKPFINSYIIGREKLPIAEYFNTIGINYIEEQTSSNTKPWFGFSVATFNSKDYYIYKNTDYSNELGLKKDDKVYSLFGKKVNGKSFKKIIEKRNKMDIGAPFEITVIRDGEKISAKGNLQKRVDRHVFEINQNATDKQIKLRSIWQNN